MVHTRAPATLELRHHGPITWQICLASFLRLCAQTTVPHLHPCLQYRDEDDLAVIMHLIDNELSEPYSIFTYRYFLHNWPSLCWIAYEGDKPFGTVVCKMEVHRGKLMRGYVAMLVVDKSFRGKGAGAAIAPACKRSSMHGRVSATPLLCKPHPFGCSSLPARGVAAGWRQTRMHRHAGWAPPFPPHRPGLAWPRLGLCAGRELVRRSIQEMVAGGCEEVVLEAEVCNEGALRLYQSLGFVRDKRLHRCAGAPDLVCRP